MRHDYGYRPLQKVNDTWGHPVGDQVIKTVVNIIGRKRTYDQMTFYARRRRRVWRLADGHRY
ncbi:GGDEF domain-containing protein [Escherichia coli]|nr:GGDEF domain-containing protein [Escherichia coli]